MVQWVTKSTMMSTARGDMSTTMMTMYINVDNDTSSTTSDEGNTRKGQQSQSQRWQRHLRIDDNDVCASAMGKGRRINQLANRGKWEGRRTRGKQEGRRQRTRGGGAPRGQEAAAARREASRQPAGGASGASSSSSASFLPRRDGGPCENPSDGGGSDVSHVIREFGIGEIRASTVVVVINPLTSPPLLPPSDARRTLLAAAAPAAKQLWLQR
jgi:hypothetical protein